MDPSANNYLAATEWRDNVILSSNSGRNWTAITGTLTIAHLIGVSVANGGQIVVVLDEDATDGQCVYLTKNVGLTWSGPLGPTISTNEVCIASALNSDGSIIVVSVENIGLYVSSDQEGSWQLVYTFTDADAFSILYNPSLAVFYASLSNGDNDDPPKIKSDNSALEWTVLPGIYSNNPFSFDTTGFGVSSSGDKIFIADFDLYYSTDPGTTYYEAVDSTSYYACISSDASLFLYATTKVVYTNNSLPEPVDDGDDDDDDDILSLSCSDSSCPTNYPYGYSGGYTLNGCNVYCKSQPLNGQCLPGGSGCDSSCRSAGMLAGIIIGVVIGFLLIVGLIVFACYKCGCCRKAPATSKSQQDNIAITSVLHDA
jgi:hypothetical protein